MESFRRGRKVETETATNRGLERKLWLTTTPTIPAGLPHPQFARATGVHISVSIEWGNLGTGCSADS